MNGFLLLQRLCLAWGLRLSVVGISSALAQPVAMTAPEAQARWFDLPPMPVGVFDASAVKSGRSAIITGGLGSMGMTCSTVQILDLDSLDWTTPMALKTPRCQHAGVAIDDGLVLVAGGKTGTLVTGLLPTPDCELIDLANGSVELLPPLPTPSDGPTAHRLPNGQAVVIGDRHASLFDPKTRSWGSHIPLREPRSCHASLVLPDGRVLVIGGVNRDTIELVDFDQQRSILLADRLPMPLDDLRALLLPDGRVWILGGQNSRTGDTTDRTWLMDLTANKHQRLIEGPSLSLAEKEQVPMSHGCRHEAEWATVADAFLTIHESAGGAILGGGESQQKNQDTELDAVRFLDFNTLTVRSLPKMNQPHDDAVAVAIEQGVIVMGGYLIETVCLPLLAGQSVAVRTRRPTASNRVELLLLPSPPP